MQTSLIRGLLVALALALAGLSAWSLRFFKRYQPLAGLMQGPRGLDSVGLQVTNAVVTGRVGGHRRWRVAAHTITFSRDQRQVSVDGIHDGTLFDDRERPLVALTAGSAVFQSLAPVFGSGAQGTLQVGGGLRARLLRPHGPTVSTASLVWDPVAGQVSSLGTVVAQFPEHAGAISGMRLDADSVLWESKPDLLRSPGQVTMLFAGGAGAASGRNVTVDVPTGNFHLQQLHGTFRLPTEVTAFMPSRTPNRAPMLAGLLLASTTLPPAPAAPAPPDFVTYDAGASSWLSAPHVVQMSQGVKFNQNDAWLETNSAIVNLDDQEQALNAESRAPVHLWDSQNDLTGQHGYIDFTKHLATVQNKITLVVKPGPANANAAKGSARSRFKDPATMTCEKMIYNYRLKTGEVPGLLTVRQKDRVLVADSGTYDGRSEIVILTGHVHGYDHDNRIEAPQVYFGVREGDEFIRIDSHVHGVFKQKPDANDTSDNPPPPEDPKAYDTFKDGGPAASQTAPAAPNSGGAGVEPATPAISPPTFSSPNPTPPELGGGGRSSPALPPAATGATPNP